VSTFYLLPPRPFLGRQVATFLQGCFPGLDCGAKAQAEWVELLGQAVQQQPDVYVVFREDLPEDVDLMRTLVLDFGAAAGDDVVEVATAGSARRWSILPLAA